MKGLEGSRSKVRPPETTTIILNIVLVYCTICGLTSFVLGPEALLISGLLLLMQVALAGEFLDLRHQSVPWLLLSLLAAVWAAAVVGVQNYHSNYAPYFSAKHGRFYKDVDASTRTAEFLDAGKISFTADAILDDTMSVGMSLFGGTYCAAPIVSQAAASASANGRSAANPDPSASSLRVETKSFVQFWAVGKDCCASRGDFTCDSARLPDAHSGILLREVIEEELGSLAHSNKLQHDGYLMAVRAACALHNLETAEVPALMYWVSSPDSVLFAWFTRSFLLWFISSIAFAIVFSVFWLVMANFLERQQHEFNSSVGQTMKPSVVVGEATGLVDRTVKTETTAGGGVAKSSKPWWLFGSQADREPVAAALGSSGAGSPGQGSVPWPQSHYGTRGASRGAVPWGSRAASPGPSRARR